MTNTAPQSGPKRRAGVASTRILAVALIVGAAALAYQVSLIREGGGFTVVGPRVFPAAVVFLFACMSVLLLLRVTIWPDGEMMKTAAHEAATTHWPSIGWTALVLVAYPFALDRLGYIIGTTLFVPLVARILGSHKLVRDLLIGAVLAVLIYVGFTRVLGIRLPAGILAPLL
jgi:putative tricarboxylic transport membrane protein